MEELIFFGVIILFSILESIARSRKKRAGGGAPQIPGEWEPEADTEDEGESWRTAAPAGGRGGPGETRGRYSQPYGTTAGRGRPGTSGSEGIIPADIWEEIAGLAEGSEARRKGPEPVATPAPPPEPEGA